MAKILVTGGAGFIGSHLCETLVRKGHAVTVFDNLQAARMENLDDVKNKIKITDGDVRDNGAVDNAANGMDYIVHLAAFVSARESVEKPQEAYAVNVQGTRNVLDAAARNKVKKVVIASSAAVYGDAKPPIKENAACKPLSPYGESKLANERDAHEFFTKYKLPAVCLRFFNVYGPRQRGESEYAGVITKFIGAFANGKQPVIYGDGAQTRDFIYVEDVVSVIIAALESKNKEADGEIINVGSGMAVSINELVKTIAQIMKKQCAPKYEAKKQGDILHSCADVSKMKALLGVMPKFSLENGLRETIRYALSGKT